MRKLVIFLVTIGLGYANLTQATETSKCYNEGHYVVMGTAVPDDNVGTNFTIYKKAKASEKVTCPLKKNGTWTIPNNEAEYYLGQKGDLLILDSGTSEQGRSIIIWNLAQRKKIKNFPYEVSASIKGDNIIYWTRSKDKVTPQNCPNLKEFKKVGLDTAIDYQELLDLKTLKVKKTTIKQCSGVS